MRTDLSIIIINWKSCDFVERCLASIAAHHEGLICEVLVVDNASYDGCEQMVKCQYPSTRFIQSSENLGFAGANNLGFQFATGRNVLFLNPDTEVCEGALLGLFRALESLDGAGMVGARLLNSDGSLQTTCVTALPSILNQALSCNLLRGKFPLWKMWGTQSLFRLETNPVAIEAISGACMLAKREVLTAVGCFTSDYFMYAEDMDLCFKVSRAGWKIYYVPTSEIVHHAGGSSSSRSESHFSTITTRESVLAFFRLRRGRGYAQLYRLSTVIVAMIRISVLLVVAPISVHPRFRPVSRALSKWFSVFSWALGFKGPEKTHTMLPGSSDQATAKATAR